MTNEMTFEQLCELFGYTPAGRPLDTKAVADLLGVHASTVDHYRLRGEGPRFFSPPGTRRVWYAERDVLGWMASGARQHERPGRGVATANLECVGLAGGNGSI